MSFAENTSYTHIPRMSEILDHKNQRMISFLVCACVEISIPSCDDRADHSRSAGPSFGDLSDGHEIIIPSFYFWH